MTNHFEFKEHAIKSIENDLGKDIFFRDTKQSGLGLKVTPNGIKTFFVEGWVNGRSRRKKIGRSPEVSVEQARKDAKGFMGDFSRGIDKVAHLNAKKRAEITLEQLFKDYLADRPKLKPGTVNDYNRVMDEGLDDWKTRKISTITRPEVTEKHRELSKNSQARSDNTMRVLRALFNYAMHEYEITPGEPLIPYNPVLILTSKKTWNHVPGRASYIPDDKLEAWFKTVINLQPLKNSHIHEVVSDYLQLLILSGFRETEGKRLEWRNIDFKKKTFTAEDTKNGLDQVLPMSDYLETLFQRRLEKRAGSQYVFPNKDGGRLKDLRNWYGHASVQSGAHFTLHDLRRTFATVAESLDSSHYAIKRLINHKADKSDVTEGYIQMDVERLRAPMQAITDRILTLAKIK